MPVCKYCGSKISNKDFDICPHCGEKDPIDEKYKTKDITSFVDPVTGEPLYKSKSKKVAGILEATLGTLGVADFYLGFIMKGIISLVITGLAVGGIGSLLYFLISGLTGNVMSYIIPFLVVFVIHALMSLRYFLKADIKGADGELLI